jgi:hypothetical protein
LKIDYGRPAIVAYQKIGFLAEVVVRDTGTVNMAQQACGAVKVGAIGGSGELHRPTFDIGTQQRVCVDTNKPRYAFSLREKCQRARFPIHQPARQPTESGRRGGAVPRDDKQAADGRLPHHTE